MLRKFAALLCVAAMSVVFVGCEAESTTVTPPVTSETTTDTTADDAALPADDAADAGDSAAAPVAE